ncbi:hypothetical protein KC218_29635, partial [Mycobacterium tuberculosis]|nr:hypothetical protein [Mycobacterium tuberculosis]
FTPSPATAVATVATPGYTYAGRPNGTGYYLVTSSDAAGNTSQPSGPADVTMVAPDPTAPSAPADLSATAGAGGVS